MLAIHSLCGNLKARPRLRLRYGRNLRTNYRSEVFYQPPRRLLKNWSGSRVEAEGADGKERARRIPARGCHERATPPDAPSASRPKGCAVFGLGRRCSLGRDHKDIRHSARALAKAKNSGNATHPQYFNSLLSGRIVETEAYPVGDAAGHAFNGVTQRNRSLFLERGHAYVYFSYGSSFLVNVTSEVAGWARVFYCELSSRWKDRGCIAGRHEMSGQRSVEVRGD